MAMSFQFDSPLVSSLCCIFTPRGVWLGAAMPGDCLQTQCRLLYELTKCLCAIHMKENNQVVLWGMALPVWHAVSAWKVRLNKLMQIPCQFSCCRCGSEQSEGHLCPSETSLQQTHGVIIASISTHALILLLILSAEGFPVRKPSGIRIPQAGQGHLQTGICTMVTWALWG